MKKAQEFASAAQLNNGFSDKLLGLNASPSVNTFEPNRFELVMASPAGQANSALEKKFSDALPLIPSNKTVGKQKSVTGVKEPSVEQIKQNAFDYSKRRDSYF